MIAVMKGSGDQCEVEDNYSIQCNNAVDVRRVVIVDIGNIGDDSNFNNELDACHDYDDDVRLRRNIDWKHLALFTAVKIEQYVDAQSAIEHESNTTVQSSIWPNVSNQYFDAILRRNIDWKHLALFTTVKIEQFVDWTKRD